MPFEQIITSEQCIIYTSDNVKILEKYSLRDRIYQSIVGDYPKHGCIVYNPTKSIQYVGLNLNSG
jgi:hypothetical protein